jgi:hypothetical protein
MVAAFRWDPEMAMKPRMDGMSFVFGYQGAWTPTGWLATVSIA